MENGRNQIMSEEQNTAQTRKGLGGSVAGKAKEVAGAVLGDELLTAEGRLQQAEARQRRDAAAVDAAAGTVAEDAGRRLREEQARAREVRQEAAAEAALEDATTERQRARGHAEAEQQAQAEVEWADAAAGARTGETIDQAAARRQAAHAAAAGTQAAAQRDHSAGTGSAAAAEQAAARARAHASGLAPAAGVPSDGKGDHR
jgi:uncharacterized protein YjbJ (UPF0337 family)